MAASLALKRAAANSSLLSKLLNPSRPAQLAPTASRLFNTNAQMTRYDDSDESNLEVDQRDRSVSNRCRGEFPSVFSDVFDPLSPTRSLSQVLNMMDQFMDNPFLAASRGMGTGARRGWDVKEDIMFSYNFATIFRVSRTCCRNYQSIASKFMKNIKEEMAKNKELQENKKQLEERLKKLADTSVKEKYMKIQKESNASTELIKHQLNEFSDYVNKLAVSIKDSQLGQDAFKQLKAAAEVAEQVAKQVGDTQVYRQVANTASEIDKLADVRMYSKPEELRMRSDSFTSSFAQRHVDVNLDATQVELHKESRWYSGWKAFSESNPYYNKLLDWKMRIDESENIVFRGVRSTMERIQLAFTSQDDVSIVLTEISKVDPNFNKHNWLRFCEKEMIPNILEAVIQMNVDVLNDWCYERAFKMISQGINEYSKIGYNTFDSQIIDVSKVEMVSGKMMDQGPTLVITFQVFMIHVLKNKEGKVIEGDPNNAIRVHHVWVLCRDMEEFNPATAWKLLELHVQKGNLVL